MASVVNQHLFPIAGCTPLLAVALVAGLVAPGCTLPRAPRSLVDTDPTAKIPAIKSTADGNDQQSVDKLVAELNSDDPAIRFYAIRALQRLTGESLGYRYFDDEIEREPALRRWDAWLKAQNPASDTPGTPPATQPTPATTPAA